MARTTRMNQEQRSERSRAQILRAALKLFSRRGYRARSMRDIALTAKVSTGNVYHQFPDKETIFNTLLDEYWKAIASPEHPFNKALAAGAFPNDLEALGRAARDSVAQYRPYVGLIYVDVVEFEGRHIRKFYADMASRFGAYLEANREQVKLERLRPDVSPTSAVMIASRLFLHIFPSRSCSACPTTSAPTPIPPSNRSPTSWVAACCAEGPAPAGPTAARTVAFVGATWVWPTVP